MNKEQIIEAASLYLAHLVGQGAKPVRISNLSRHSNDFDEEDIRNHLAWMADFIIKMAGGNDAEKAMRWLCFVQGCLFMLGDYSIEEYRSHNGIREIP